MIWVFLKETWFIILGLVCMVYNFIWCAADVMRNSNKWWYRVMLTIGASFFFFVAIVFAIMIFVAIGGGLL